MAKWGEGDPRWIVEERADATNVNNWHWSEKNATLWSKDKLRELLNGLIIENDEFSCKFKEITKLEGEASANNRKSKLIFFYEWTIVGDWEGVVKNAGRQVFKGTYELLNLSEEYDPAEADLSITFKDGRQDKLKDFIRIEGLKKVREQAIKYVSLLKEEFSTGLIKPTTQMPVPAVVKTTPVEKLPQTTATPASQKAASNGSVGVKIPTTNLVMHEDFKCRVGEIYDIFVNINMVRAFTHNSIESYEAVKDGKFSLFDSNITGSFVELTPNKRITMNWRNKRWPEGHLSLATLEFKEKEDCTEIKLSHMGIPQAYMENTEEGWKRFYWNAIRQTFGFGSGLL